MGLYLQTNTSALTAESYFNQSNMQIQQSFTKLSSGYRINSAADDAAGLGIAKSMNAQIQSYSIASQNGTDAVSMVQTADGSADQVDGLLTRMRELAVEAQNGTMSTNDVGNLNTEFQQDLAEIDRVAGDANFNGTQACSPAPRIPSTSRLASTVRRRTRSPSRSAASTPRACRSRARRSRAPTS